ncbi:hypothetical protein CPB86DRAFT_871644 [Serendipita vermifera]|nr:hypothetical protein CPB86DRAFT_871644 [Serendipita vermifera]
MAANIDFSRIPGKKGDPYRGQAVYQPEKKKDWDGEHKIKLPPIPDFRFESAYLAAIRPFVHKSPEGPSPNVPGTKNEAIAEASGVVSDARFDYGVPLRINWGAVLWVTLRDQVIVQFITGGVYATWAMFATPFFRNIRVGISNIFTLPKKA